MKTNDIFGYISLAVQNNKKGVIEAMNATGNSISSYISNADLIEKLWNIYSQSGIPGLKNVLDKVAVTNKITEEQAKTAVTKFRNIDPNTNAKFGDWIQGVGNYFGDLLGGSTVTGGTVTNVTSTAAISPAMIGLIVVIGLILIVLFRKFIAVVVGIIVIVLAVVLYGVFARNLTTTSTGGGTTTHGGIGQVVLGWLTGKF